MTFRQSSILCLLCGGHLLLEFYNPWSLRTLAKRVAGPGHIAAGTTEADVYTRYDTVARARGYLPSDLEFVGVRDRTSQRSQAPRPEPVA